MRTRKLKKVKSYFHHTAFYYMVVDFLFFFLFFLSLPHKAEKHQHLLPLPAVRGRIIILFFLFVCKIPVLYGSAFGFLFAMYSVKA